MKEKYGQYMTPEIIAEFMVSLIKNNKKSKVLEPASGKGIFINTLKKHGFYNIVAYEIDSDLIEGQDDVINTSFVSADIPKDFDVVIGNPPYIRWKNLENELKEELVNNELFNKYLNALNDYSSIFIIKSIDVLKEGGELIFITPDYWLDTTHSLNLRNFIVQNGYISEMYTFKETPIFKKVNVSLLIFRFVKSKKEKPKSIKVFKCDTRKELSENVLCDMKNSRISDLVDFFEIPQFEINKPWILAKADDIELIESFEKSCYSENYSKVMTINDVCEIGNGMVSGLDKAFQIEDVTILNSIEQTGMLSVIKAKDLEQFSYSKITNYIFLNNIEDENEFKNNYPNFYKQLQAYKSQLLKRYSYNRDISYWHWVFLRNYNLFKSNDKKIFVPCKERISNKDYHRFTLVYGDIYPTQDVTAIIPKPDTKESIEYICAHLNSKSVFNWIKHKGIIKGNIVEFSRAPVASIPFRSINFYSSKECEIHDRITDLVKAYIKTNNKTYLDNVNFELDKLYKL